MIDFITHPVFLWIVGFLLVSGILMWIASYFVASYCIYYCTLRRRKNAWGREMPADITDLQRKMYESGVEWSLENQDFKKDVHIFNNGANLYGEYYDFGKKRCAVVLSGRTESLVYGYYFAIPYAKNDCNILVLDPRSHGLSDGEFNTVGFEESKDAIAWVKYIKSTYGICSFVFHGICIGAATGMLALNSPDCPDCIDGIVTEGMFPNFRESMKNHMIEKKKPVFITIDLVDKWMIHYTGHSMKFGPIDIIEKINTPLLMLHSKEDLYSTPEYAKKLFILSGAENKNLVWFEHGAHSMLRITDTKLYDKAISNFLAGLPIREEAEVDDIKALRLG